ncbi:YhcN/YlaJ family sporulation lipoprotein [Paenibacillus turpanensis]|uniref:YhcN/YlaJ family sporulation lipoprotein n=1 Tax=Paenibacillus turpanensis TaxID=2689078 RepID=UPI0014092C6F|nr:YhcN/YlaJ family sporulation lipoprotein [Paenibacillus turpanensis]
MITQKRNGLAWIRISFLGIVLLTGGCAYEGDYEGSDADLSSRDDMTPQTKAYGDIGTPTDHNNTRFEMNQDAANAVAQMDGIFGAYVALTDKNAYVAVALDDTAHGTVGHGGRIDTNNTGQSEGEYDPFTHNPQASWRDVVTDTNSYYTFPTLNEDDMNDKLKQKIAVRLRTLYPYVRTVHISANRTFLNTMNTYAQETWLGRDLQPHLEDFNGLVKSVFAGRE